jgi:hypothetical protein
MDDALMRQQAAETLREIRSMEQRTRAATSRYSPIPLVIFGVAALLASPFGFIESEVASAIALGAALLGAVAVTGAYHSRQPVHPASPKRQGIRASDVVVWVVIAILAFMGLPVILFILSSDATLGMLFLFTGIAIAVGKRINNGALALTSGFALIGGTLGSTLTNEHWQVSMTGFYGASFLVAALLVYIDRRNEA